MTVDVLAVGAHPDDVELGCGGTLALLAQTGRSVGVLHLTSGESGTRGSADLRRDEASEAANVLGVTELEFLDFGDGFLQSGKDQEDALISVLRRWRPEIVLAPAPRDRHPDHGRASRLTVDACFYAGLKKLGTGDPHRPSAVYSYLQHDLEIPSFIVDISSTWAQKMAALDAYESQLHQPGQRQRQQPQANLEPQTKISSPMFRAAVEGRARHFGLQIGVEFGEPFVSQSPLPIHDLFALRSKGIR